MLTAELSGMYGASDRRSVSAGNFLSNDLLEARESARAGNELFEFTQLVGLAHCLQHGPSVPSAPCPSQHHSRSA